MFDILISAGWLQNYSNTIQTLNTFTKTEMSNAIICQKNKNIQTWMEKQYSYKEKKA